MKITVAEAGHILLEDVFSGVELKSPAGESMGISMRDSGFEFVYQGVWYEAKEGIVKAMPTKPAFTDAALAAISPNNPGR